MKLLNSHDKSEPQNMSQRWRNNVHSGSRAKIVPPSNDHDERDSTPVLMSAENPRGSYRDNKKRLKNSFFITNALNNEAPQNNSPDVRSRIIQNSYYAISDHQNEKDELTKFNVSQTKYTQMSNIEI